MFKLKSILTTKCWLFANVIVSHIYKSRIHRLGMVKKRCKQVWSKEYLRVPSYRLQRILRDRSSPPRTASCRRRPRRPSLGCRTSAGRGSHRPDTPCRSRTALLWADRKMVVRMLHYSIHWVSNVCSSA